MKLKIGDIEYDGRVQVSGSDADLHWFAQQILRATGHGLDHHWLNIVTNEEYERANAEAVREREDWILGAAAEIQKRRSA